MIKVIDKNNVKLYYFPKNSSNYGEDIVMTVKNTTTKISFMMTFDVMEEYNDYYLFNIDFSGVDDGEYEYKIRSKNRVSERGLILVGKSYDDQRSENTVSYSNNSTYIEYEG